jgi:hypothetical protein
VSADFVWRDAGRVVVLRRAPEQLAALAEALGTDPAESKLIESAW